MDETPKKIEIVNGDGKDKDGKDLNISPVYDHLKIARPKTKEDKKNKKIIIPEEKKTNK